MDEKGFLTNTREQTISSGTSIEIKPTHRWRSMTVYKLAGPGALRWGYTAAGAANSAPIEGGFPLEIRNGSRGTMSRSIHLYADGGDVGVYAFVNEVEEWGLNDAKVPSGRDLPAYDLTAGVLTPGVD